MFCLTFSCGINRHMLMIPPGTKLPIILIRNSLSEGLATSRFSLFCVALADRYIAICKPLTYQGHFIRVHFEKLLMLSFFFPLAYKGIFIVIYADAMCVDNIAGSRHMSNGNLFSNFIDICGILIISLIFITFFVINIVRELRRSLHSSRQQRLYNDRSDLRRAYCIHIGKLCGIYRPVCSNPTLRCTIQSSAKQSYVYCFSLCLPNMPSRIWND